jgi:hypothetical protein
MYVVEQSIEIKVIRETIQVAKILKFIKKNVMQ